MPSLSLLFAHHRPSPRTPKDASATERPLHFYLRSVPRLTAPSRCPRAASKDRPPPYSCIRGLTFELSGRRRQDAKPGPVKMYRVPPDRAWWPAVGAPLERGVRQRAAVVTLQAKCSRSNFGALTRQPRWRPVEMTRRGDAWPALTRADTDVQTRF